MADTEFWRDLKPITSVFRADALPHYAENGVGVDYVESLLR